MNDEEFNRKDFERCFKFYEKAIEGRNEHYKNYSTWTNLYAIFNGAIFIGFYSAKDAALEMLLCLLGFLAAFCWFQSLRGYYHWMISWIKLVHKYEEKLGVFSKPYDKYRVYFFFDKTIPASFSHRNLSTQKITALFVFALMLSWAYLIYRNFKDEFLMLVIFVIILLFCVFELTKVFASDVSEMKGEICEENTDSDS